MRRLLVAAAFVLAFAAPALAAPALSGTMHGQGSAASFQVFGNGLALEGGAYRWNLVCGGCEARLSLTEGVFVLAQDGGGQTLLPGVYELRGFMGILSHAQRAPNDFAVEIHGTGAMRRIG